MKIQGTIKLGALKLPENFPVQVGDIAIDYNADFAVNEMVELVDLVRTLPDVVADVVRKFKGYEEEFSKPNRTQEEVEAAIREAEMIQKAEQSA